jgi:hypothetical protein
MRELAAAAADVLGPAAAAAADALLLGRMPKSALQTTKQKYSNTSGNYSTRHIICAAMRAVAVCHTEPNAARHLRATIVADADN